MASIVFEITRPVTLCSSLETVSFLMQRQIFSSAAETVRVRRSPGPRRLARVTHEILIRRNLARRRTSSEAQRESSATKAVNGPASGNTRSS
jgi:hypothetical protein